MNIGRLWKGVGRSKARDIGELWFPPFAKNAKDGAPGGKKSNNERDWKVATPIFSEEGQGNRASGPKFADSLIAGDGPQNP